MKILADFHHSSLLRSLVLLFEDRLGHELHRPIGMDWWDRGLWRINDLEPTARQFLLAGQEPADCTPPLNDLEAEPQFVKDPGGMSRHRVVTLEQAESMDIELMIVSHPGNLLSWLQWRGQVHPQAKLVVQMGNEWPLPVWPEVDGVLASVMPRAILPSLNLCWYRQEFDEKFFRYVVPRANLHSVASYVNCIREKPQAWYDLNDLDSALGVFNVRLASYGGQCPDGCLTGPAALAFSMHSQMAILNSKDGGDGYGHVIHNAYACGRPVIIRKGQYAGQLASRLFKSDTYWDLDEQSPMEIATQLARMPMEELLYRCQRARSAFDDEVDFVADADRVGKWLETL